MSNLFIFHILLDIFPFIGLKCDNNPFFYSLEHRKYTDFTVLDNSNI